MTPLTTYQRKLADVLAAARPHLNDTVRRRAWSEAARMVARLACPTDGTISVFIASAEGRNRDSGRMVEAPR